ncbi:hypothetical protein EIP86_011444 [Pleurotus ostreatoroseus]|nr:hypothetical protein EIP86_011444 [Pleurotus ostreatoroseus]
MRVDELKKARPNQLLFSRNAVCVDLSGPQLADLAFVDLPGIVQYADDSIVKLVEDLVKSHISRDKGNCLILVTLPMSDDIENQKAMRLAREADPQGLRTIGVLTKPDLVTTAQQKSLWLDVIEGRKHPLKHGYYCTRQPDEDDRAQGMTASEARVAEADYFLKTVPWVKSAHQSRFGTQNLVSNLSRLLSKLIDERLPTLSQETSRILSECDNRLDALPAPITSEPSAFVLGLVTSFCNIVRSHVQGQALATELVQDTRRTYRTFKADIRGTAPPFVPLKDKNSQRLDLNRDVMDLVKVDDEEVEEDNIVFVGVPGTIYLEDVRKRIAMAVTRELPNNVPYSVKLFFISQFQKTWQAHVQKCATEIHRKVKEGLTDLVQAHFGLYVHLEPHIQIVVDELIQSTYKAARAQLGKILRYETSAYTQNEHYLSSSKEAFLTKYKALRTKAKSNPLALGAQPVSLGSSQISAFLASPWKPYKLGIGYPSECDGTGRFDSHNIKEPGLRVEKYQSISMHPFYSKWSFEELRVVDYKLQQKSATVSPGSDQTQAKSNAFAQPSGPFSGGFAPLFSVPIASTPSQAATPSTTTTALAPDEKESELLAALARFGISGLSASDVLGKLNPPDEYQEEIEVMAEVRAYFKVTYKRIIDFVPLTIDHEFLFALADSLQDRLVEKMGLGTDGSAERCKAYLAEDHHIVATREELMSRKKRLEKVREQLLDFGL